MSISTKITVALANIQAQVAAATPLAGASFPTVRAMQLNAADLLAYIQTDLTALSPLDTWVAPTDPETMVAGFNDLVTAANDQSTLSLMRGVVGRAAANLARLA
ncbi:hypothetical protein [Bradyrhizobium sp. SZCCHNR3015]|uniref:hypothetical protein n=1 Tax=Bradyrhizobium sp. SZCCHNR3015 TaxID=3057395 RepID=UPI002916A777|nr:hypothetical protein [Bradyrhizobium sp. SZCCHNR3015]